MKIAELKCWLHVCRRLSAGLLVAGLACLLAGGCVTELNTTYGRAAGGIEPISVNGTDVLVGMFKEAGHEVTTRSVLVTDKFDEVDTIVWFPDDFAAPKEELIEWFDTWLAGQPGRTLVYVGRDFDSAPLYWRAMLPYVSDSQREAYQRRIKFSRMFTDHRRKADDTVECDWFKIDTKDPRSVRALSGAWRAGVDPANVEIELRDRLVPAKGGRELLRSAPDTIVSRLTKRKWGGSKAIVVANGSFLLNLPLVNREHRVLASELLASVGGPGRVVFLESRPGGPAIDPPAGALGLWRLFGAWPLNVILLQLAALGIIFCFARWPVFGRPRVPPMETTSDFSKHIDAVAALLGCTRARDYALARLQEIRPAT